MPLNSSNHGWCRNSTLQVAGHLFDAALDLRIAFAVAHQQLGKRNESGAACRHRPTGTRPPRPGADCAFYMRGLAGLLIRRSLVRARVEEPQQAARPLESPPSIELTTKGGSVSNFLGAVHDSGVFLLPKRSMRCRRPEAHPLRATEACPRSLRGLSPKAQPRRWRGASPKAATRHAPGRRPRRR